MYILKRIKKILLYVLCIVILSFLSSCEIQESPTNEGESFYMPEPINQYAFEKETETTTIMPTKAKHEYDTNFKLKAEKEITISTDNFLTKVNYVKNHMSEFADTMITIDGLFGRYTSWDGTFHFPMIYRNGPACCGDDQYGGFFLVNFDETQFNLDDWIEVKGKPFNYEHEDSDGEKFNYPFILVDTIKVLESRERKAEMVND